DGVSFLGHHRPYAHELPEGARPSGSIETLAGALLLPRDLQAGRRSSVVAARRGSRSARGGDPPLARDAGARGPAVAARILGEVLLVIALGVVERRGWSDLRGDHAVPGTLERRLVRFAGGERGRLLGLAVRVDRRAVLRPDVVPLPHPLRRIVPFPEDAKQGVVAHRLRV